MHEEYKVDNEITLFRDCNEKYVRGARPLTRDEFIKCLETKTPVFVSRNTLVISYNLDRTKLAIKRFYHLKEYVLVPNKNILRAKITKQLYGVTIDLNRCNVFSYTRGNVKRGGNWCRTNNFNSQLYRLSNELINTLPKERSLEFYQIIKDELGLITESNNIGEIVRGYYFNKRNINYFNDEFYLSVFCRYFEPNRYHYNGLNIFQITNLILDIKNPEYVEYFYQNLKKWENKSDPNQKYLTINLYNLKLCDVYNVDITNLKSLGVSVEETDASIPNIRNFIILLNSINSYYNFSFVDLISEKRESAYHKLLCLKTLQRFGYVLNIENFRTIDRINGTLLVLFGCLYSAFNKTGAYIIDSCTIKSLKKYFGDEYTVQPGFDPTVTDVEFSPHICNDMSNFMKPTLGSYVSNYSHTYIKLKHKRKSKSDRYILKICNLRSLVTPKKDKFSQNIQHKENTPLERRIKSFIQYFDSNAKNIKSNFEFKYVFSEKSFIDLCEDKKINYNKYLTKI